jgi:ribonuclease PH
MRSDGRNNHQLRTPRITPDFCPGSFGSILIEMGNTRVICAASIGTDVPEHAEKRGTGWITAEYSLLPYSTSPRTGRDLFRRDGRSVEIQRLIARSLRGTADLSLMKNYVVTVDCDVLQADGGTRTAAITGGFIALKRAAGRMVREGLIPGNPIHTPVAAISAGLVGGEMRLDLNYQEDSCADVDLNVVMDGSLNIIEVQGTGERSSFAKSQLDEMLGLAEQGIRELLALQQEY